ncbi:MAG: PilZ domain-containing protein [Beijerinckiaceae bacterium]|jgi:hypothetical protein
MRACSAASPRRRANPGSGSLRLSDGNTHPVKLIDISLSGAALATEVQPPLGATVTIGQTSGTVVRNFMGGIAVEFFRPIPVEGFNEDITL